MYREFFHQHFDEIDALNYARLSWNDDDVSEFMNDFVEGDFAVKITDLDLSFNKIGVLGCRSIAQKIISGKMPILEWFAVSGNPLIGDAGCHILAPMIANMKVVCLNQVGMGDAGCKALANSFVTSSKQTTRLTHLWIEENDLIGDAGMKDLLRVVDHCKSTFEFLAISHGSSTVGVRHDLQMFCRNNHIDLLLRT